MYVFLDSHCLGRTVVVYPSNLPATTTSSLVATCGAVVDSNHAAIISNGFFVMRQLYPNRGKKPAASSPEFVAAVNVQRLRTSVKHPASKASLSKLPNNLLNKITTTSMDNGHRP
jgi:hypothetical protein